MPKALVLLSGGLDSILAAKIIMEQDIELEAVSFITVFCTCTSKSSSCLASQKAAGQLGLKLKVFNPVQEYLEIVKSPKYGYGRNMNPCLDCRIFMFKKAKDYMPEIGASFIVTGEVLGERPMSQRREAMRIIERGAGLEGLILRPLSARLFEPTIPEKEGWVNRDKLLSIKGRSRKPQIKLAQEKNILDYPCPAGGCLLTDKGFGNRLRDLFEHNHQGDQNGGWLNEIKLLKIGRHFRVSDKAKIIVCRDKDENESVMIYLRPGDIWLETIDYLGPTTLIRGEADKEAIELAASFTARYSRAKTSEGIKVSCRRFSGDGKETAQQDKEEIIVTSPVSDDIYSKLRI